MTREDREILQKLVLEIVTQANPWELHMRYDFCGSFSENIQSVQFSAKGISNYITKKLGYTIRKDIIKHALMPIKIRDNYFEIKRVV